MRISWGWTSVATTMIASLRKRVLCLLGSPEYPLVAQILYASGFSGRYDGAEHEYGHKKFL